MSILVLRLFFLLLCTAGGYAVSAVHPDLLNAQGWWTMVGFGFGGLLIAIDEMVKGLSLRAFSAATFGLILGTTVAWLLDQSGLFIYADDKDQWLIRLALFIGFSYLGMILAMRSNKEDFSLIIPYVRFQPKDNPQYTILLDTSVIIDGRIAEMINCNFLEGILIIPRFVLKELHQVADSSDPIKKERGRHGLEMLARLQSNNKTEVKIHEGDVPSEKEVDTKLIYLAKTLGAKIFTCDFNLSKIAELHSVPCLRINDLANAMKKVLLPGEILNIKIVREGKDKGQGVGYINDGTMVVVNEGQNYVGQQVDVQILSLLQTGAGVMIFADIKAPIAA